MAERFEGNVQVVDSDGRPLRNRDFLPGSQEFFTFDTVGELALGDIRRLRLTRTDGPGEDRGPWRPARVDLHLNGVRVFRSEPRAQDVGRGDTLTLPYPAG